jgi:hypothetical protein
MRIFRVGSKSRKLRKQNSFASRQQLVEPIPSIGSELAASDQFEILVSAKDSGLNSEHRRKNKSSSFLSYFSSENDDSTVSSLTTGEYGFFHNKKPYYYNATNAADSISSWCCCVDSDNTTAGATRRTHPSSTDNTLIQNSAYGTLQPNDSRSQQYRSMNGSRCCGPETISPRHRSFLFSNYWGRHRNANNNHSIQNANASIKNVPNMSASLFDNLSEDELDIKINRSNSFSVGRRGGIRNQNSNPVSLRRAITWKRRILF